MNLSDLGKTVAKFAPALGTALGGPAGLAIGAGIAQIFGGDINDQDDLINRINQDPQAAIKLQELKNSLTLGLSHDDVEDYKTSVDDRKNARQRLIDLAKAGVSQLVLFSQEIVQASLSILVVWKGLEILHQYQTTPTVESEKIVLLVGALITQVLSFYLGSSPGERRRATGS